MQAHTMSKMYPATITKLSSFTWALLLVTPLFILAEGSSNRLLFHVFLFLGGWLSWTYTEYFFHRFIMHNHNQAKGLGKLLNHSHHHKDPADIRVNTIHRTGMIFFSLGFVLIAVFLNDYFTIFSGYICGFTIYSLMHVVLHHKWSATLFPHLHQFHIHHHCKFPDKCFGVTLTWWDHLFGTIPWGNAEITERIKNFYYKTELVSNRRPGIIQHVPGKDKTTGKEFQFIATPEDKRSDRINNDKNNFCKKCMNCSCTDCTVRNTNGKG